MAGCLTYRCAGEGEKIGECGDLVTSVGVAARWLSLDIALADRKWHRWCTMTRDPTRCSLIASASESRTLLLLKPISSGTDTTLSLTGAFPSVDRLRTVSYTHLRAH